MVAQLTDAQLRELDRASGRPLQVEDPRNRARYVLIAQEEYELVLPLIRSDATSDPTTVEWDEDKNARRCELIRKKYASGLPPEEESELQALQEEMYRYRAQVAPLPLKMLEQIREALEQRASAAQ